MLGFQDAFFFSLTGRIEETGSVKTWTCGFTSSVDLLNLLNTFPLQKWTEGLLRLVQSHYFRAVFQDNLNAFIYVYSGGINSQLMKYNSSNVTVLWKMVLFCILHRKTVSSDWFLLCIYLSLTESSFPWLAFQSNSVAFFTLITLFKVNWSSH